MRRFAASLLLLVLLAGCGKYGRPQRLRPEPRETPQAEIVESSESPADEEEDPEQAP